MDDTFFMQKAIEEALLGAKQGGIPIGSVLVYQGEIIGRGHNQRIQQGSPILHGEMDALANAKRQPAKIYQASTLYTTLSPCAMCTGAILLYKIPRIVIGENRNFLGEELLLQEKGVEVIVLQNPTCISMMNNFIRSNPQLWNEDIAI